MCLNCKYFKSVPPALNNSSVVCYSCSAACGFYVAIIDYVMAALPSLRFD